MMDFRCVHRQKVLFGLLNFLLLIFSSSSSAVTVPFGVFSSSSILVFNQRDDETRRNLSCFYPKHEKKVKSESATFLVLYLNTRNNKTELRFLNGYYFATILLRTFFLTSVILQNYRKSPSGNYAFSSFKCSKWEPWP